MGQLFGKTRSENSAATRARYLVLAWLCAAAAIAYVQRNMGVAEEAIRQDLSLNKREMGLGMSAFFFTYALFQVPTAWLGHVWGTRRALTLYAVVWSALTGLSGLANGLPVFLACRLGMGAAQAGIFPCSTITVSKWLPAGRRGFASGALGSFMSVGAAVGAALTGVLLGPVGWRWLFFLFTLPGLVWAVGFYLWFRDRPQDHPAVNAAELALLPGQEEVGSGPHPLREPTPWAAILASPAMWWVGGQQFFRAAGYVFYTSWFTTYLKETRGVDTARAGLLTSLPLLGVVVGSLVGGSVSDWFLSRTGSRRLGRQGLALASTLACCLLILAAYPIADPELAVAVITVGSFCASLAAPCAYAASIDMGGRHVAAVFSLMNMAGNVGATALPAAFGWFVDVTGRWEPVLLLFAGLYLAGALCWLPINPDRPILGTSRHDASNGKAQDSGADVS